MNEVSLFTKMAPELMVKGGQFILHRFLTEGDNVGLQYVYNYMLFSFCQEHHPEREGEAERWMLLMIRVGGEDTGDII